MRYIISAEAEADLEEIGDYIALDNPERADTFIEEIRAQCDAISHMPRAYPERRKSTTACARAFTGST